MVSEVAYDIIYLLLFGRECRLSSAGKEIGEACSGQLVGQTVAGIVVRKKASRE